MFTLANVGDRVWYAEGGTPEAIDWRTAIITGFNGNPSAGNAQLGVFLWDGSGMYGVNAAYSDTSLLGSWSKFEDITF